MMIRHSIVCLLSVLVLGGCSNGGYDDLQQYMATVKAKPKGHIEPIPTFRPYKAFTYGATALRAPFSRPVEVKEITRIGVATDVQPDASRPKEFLEKYNLESLKMVGTLDRAGQLWVLIDDGDGGVHPVKEGNYLGRNHGKIVKATEGYISVVEIVSNGGDSWIERPRTLKLSEDG